MTIRARYDSGPDCARCGLKAVNVVHDDAATRARNIETWAAPSPGMAGQDYYTWADIKFHAFDKDGASGGPWNETNPEWWRLNVETRGPIAWQWLVNEFAACRESSSQATS